MGKFVRSWVLGGALLAVAVVGCRHTQSGCATCGGGHGAIATNTTNGTVYHETATSPITTPAYTPTGATGSSLPMRMPSSTGVQMIDAPGVR